MNMGKLMTEFLAGHPIKRKPWAGYWAYKYGRIEMHTKEGELIDILDTKDIIFTISGTLQEDWEIATPENCPVLKKELSEK